MLALPSGDALQLRDFSGQPVEDQPEPLESASVFESRDFMTWPAGPGRIGGPGALEVMVRRQRTRKGLDVAAREGLDDAAPEDALFSVLFAEAPDIMRRAGACGLIAERGGQEYLAVITSGKVSPRDSSVRIAQVARGGEGANPSVRMGPPRRYPGRLARAAERPFAWGETPWPDFDGDGFADLLLWKAPLPGRSVDSMAEAVTGGSWPVRLTAHLFSPGKGRYEPRPAGRIEARLPVWRLLDLARGAPLRHAVFDDLDGDGGDDCAFATDVDRYGVWLFGDGFAATPSASYAFSSVIAGIEYAGPLGPGRASAILLRTRRAVHVLEPGRD
jgi:hypothetical protein